MTIEPLDWRFQPQPREPAVGYASRLAALNGRDLFQLMRATGLSVRKLYSGRADGVRGVARLGGLNGSATEALSSNTPFRSTKHTYAKFRNESLAQGTLLPRSFRYCPHCIHQDLIDSPADVPMAARPWLRFEWLMDPIRSCRMHSVFLVETNQCREHGYVIDFSRTMADDVLPRLGDLRSEAVPSEPNDFEEWVLRRLDGVRKATDWLDAMPLHAAVTTCERLGVEGFGSDREQVSKLGDAELAAASLAGYRIAVQGEAGIERFLDTLIAKSRAAGYVGTKATYGFTLRILERHVDDPDFKPFRDIVRKHALENIPLPAGSQVLGEVLKERRLHTATSAAAASDTSYHTLRDIFARNGITPAPGGPDHRRIVIRVDEFENRLREFADALTVSELQEAIGIPKYHALELISRRMIPTLFDSHKTRMARHRIARTAVDTFMDRLFEGAVPVEVPQGRHANIGRACLVATTNVGELLGLLLDGKLTWKGRLRDGRRYADLLVDTDEVTEILQKDATPRLGLTSREIVKDMRGMRSTVVAALVRAGHLELTTEYCPAARRKVKLVTRKSLAAFTLRYRNLTDMCHVRNLSPRAAKRRLAKAGFKPAFDEGTTGNAIYEWSEALGAILDACPLRGTIWARTHRKPQRAVDT